MALRPLLPTSPIELLERSQHWFAADEALGESSCEGPLPPLVARIRKEVQAWRAEGGPACCFVHGDQASFERHPPSSFAGPATAVIEYLRQP